MIYGLYGAIILLSTIAAYSLMMWIRESKNLANCSDEIEAKEQVRKKFRDELASANSKNRFLEMQNTDLENENVILRENNNLLANALADFQHRIKEITDKNPQVPALVKEIRIAAGLELNKPKVPEKLIDSAFNKMYPGNSIPDYEAGVSQN